MAYLYLDPDICEVENSLHYINTIPIVSCCIDSSS